MISFAQNFEDVLLERCFSDRATGFYVDIGAGHPLQDSVTYWFYRRGWSGLNVDASHQMYRLLRRYRPRDTNVHAVILDESRDVRFFDLGLAGLSSVRERNAAYAEKRGFAAQAQIKTSLTLSALLEARGFTDIDFLKVDVEGAEMEVFRGLDLTRWRPQVMVVEAVDAVTQQYCNDAVVSHLEQREYEKVYFDGLNDFLIAKEHGALRSHFKTPVNLFDNVVRWSDFASLTAGGADAAAFRQRLGLRMRRHWTRMNTDIEAHAEAETWGHAAARRRPTKEDIERAYLDILCRPATLGDVASWLSAGETRALTVTTLIELLLASEEYCQKALEYGGL